MIYSIGITIHGLSCYSYFFTISAEKKGGNIRLLKCKTFEDVKEVYGENNLIKLCNIKQIVQYAVMKCQPVWIDEGYNGKLIAYYYKPETEKAWNYWKNNK